MLVLARWKNKCAAICLGAWQQLVVEESRRNLVMAQVLRRIMYRSLFGAIRSWLQYADDSQAQKCKEQHKHQLMLKIVSRMMNQQQHVCVSSMFAVWQARAFITTSRRRAARRLLCKQHVSKLCFVWYAWVSSMAKCKYQHTLTKVIQEHPVDRLGDPLSNLRYASHLCACILSGKA